MMRHSAVAILGLCAGINAAAAPAYGAEHSGAPFSVVTLGTGTPPGKKKQVQTHSIWKIRRRYRASLGNSCR
jgi:hypothetical protein